MGKEEIRLIEILTEFAQRSFELGGASSKEIANASVAIIDIFKQKLSTREPVSEYEFDYEIGFQDGWNRCCEQYRIEKDPRRLIIAKEVSKKEFESKLSEKGK